MNTGRTTVGGHMMHNWRATPRNSASLSRRGFLGRLAALGADLFITGSDLPAQTTANPRRIDVHHHFTPKAYLDYVTAANRTPGFGTWKIEADLDDMDKSGTATAILTITNPGFGFGGQETTRKAIRECNEAAAKLRSDYPGRFGSFAAIQLTDVDGSLHEIEYALDTLKADGIGLFSNYGDKWLGHASFAPVYEELNRRKTVTYVHPATADCCVNLLPNVPNEGAMIEFGSDTTRSIADLIFSGTTAHFPRHGLDFLPCRWNYAFPYRAVSAGCVSGSRAWRRDHAAAGYNR
jgi:6-methylsalicylate decarboxylase